MNIRKAANFIRENFLFYLIGFLIILGMKYFYSKAGSDDLKWILAPTARWVEILSGIPFEYEPGAGYANHDLRMLIAPSCSGVQFMTVTIAMLIFSFVHKAAYRQKGVAGQDRPLLSAGEAKVLCRQRNVARQDKSLLPAGGAKAEHCQRGIAKARRGLGWILASVLLSYLLTIFINGLRIIVAIYLPPFLDRTKLRDGFLAAGKLHSLIGIVVYFVSLLIIYRLSDDIFQKGEAKRPRRAWEQFLRKCAPPAFWYFAIVLGIPFLNRAYGKRGKAFLEYAILVSACCGAILLLYCLALLTRKLFCRKP